MALTIGNKTTSITTPVISTVTFSHNNGGGTGNYLFLLVCTDLSSTYSGVTYNGVSMTQLDERTTTSTTERWAFYRLASPASGANNVVVTFGATPYNPVSVFVVSMSQCAGEGNIVFDDTAVSPNSTSITVSANSIILGAAVAGVNTGKDITLDGSSRSLEYTHNVYNYTYAAFSASGLTAGSKTVSVSNTASVGGYYLEIKEAAAVSTGSSNFFIFAE
jgi:hypothetical protein